MNLKRCLSLAVALLMLFSLCAVTTVAEGDDWWTQEYWDLDTLLTLGAAPPAYNAETGKYEISTAEQLLFMSGEWKTSDVNSDGIADAPRDGDYLLMNDIDMSEMLTGIGLAITQASGVETQGYMPPISANKDNPNNADDGYFMGSFDGQSYAVINHRVVRASGEYVGFFGYIGYKTAEKQPTVSNLALINIEVIGIEDCGTLSGGCYAIVNNVFVTGSVTGESGVGGLVCSIKAGSGGNQGTVTNCFTLVDVNCLYEEGGGFAGKIAGYAANNFVAGSVTSAADIQYGGGFAGAYDAGVGIANNAVLTSGVYSEGGEKIGALIGSLDGDSGTTLVNNLVWDGMALKGNPDYKYPANLGVTQADAAELTAKSTYTDVLGWDFENTWEWIGDDMSGFPMLSSFSRFVDTIGLAEALNGSYDAEAKVLSSGDKLVTAAEAGEEVVLTAWLSNSGDDDAVTLYCGDSSDGSSFTDSIAMERGEAGYTAVFPFTDEGEYYYYFGSGEQTYPYNIRDAIPLTLTLPVIDGTPKELTVSPGLTPLRIGFNFITSADADTGLIRLRKAGEQEWTEYTCTSYLSFIEEGWDEIYSHYADVDVEAVETYEYQAVGIANGQEFASATYSFDALPDDGTVNIVVLSDQESPSQEGYSYFAKTYEQFILPTLGKPDFILGTGDNVENGFKASEWEWLFNECGDIYASVPNVLLPGNSEYSGDTFYKNYCARTNLPGGLDDAIAGEYTGSMIVGDVCFVFINTEIFTGSDNLAADRAAYYEAQKAWAKEVFESSGCTWRVIATHRGPYTADHDGLADVPEVLEICDELYVDLYLNGHDHSYIRVTAKDGQKLEPGQATTYLTTSAMGAKLDDYREGLIDDLVAVHVGSSDRAQQKFAYISIDGEGLHVKVFERGEEEDFSSYSEIDSFDVAESLSLQAGLVEKAPQAATTIEPTQEPQAEHEPEAETEPEDKKPISAGLIVLIILVSAAVVAIVVYLILRKKKTAVK